MCQGYDGWISKTLFPNLLSTMHPVHIKNGRITPTLRIKTERLQCFVERFDVIAINFYNRFRDQFLIHFEFQSMKAVCLMTSYGNTPRNPTRRKPRTSTKFHSSHFTPRALLTPRNLQFTTESPLLDSGCETWIRIADVEQYVLYVIQ